MALDYLTVADVLGMHTVLIRRYGGLPGVRDPGALEAALYRPQTGYYKDTIEQAAALMESLAITPPFVDGNKRIAFAATDVFLRINGSKLTRKPAQIRARASARVRRSLCHAGIVVYHRRMLLYLGGFRPPGR